MGDCEDEAGAPLARFNKEEDGEGERRGPRGI